MGLPTLRWVQMKSNGHMIGRSANIGVVNTPVTRLNLDGSDDPSNITIYLTTYSGNTIINNLRCLTWATTAGSVYITMTEQAPFGYVFGYDSKLDFAADMYLRESWTWMFYDTNARINVDSNQIAESAHFFISGSLISSSSFSVSATTTSLISTSSSSTTSATTTPLISTTSPSPGKGGISAGAAGAIGVAATLTTVALCLFVAYYCFYRTRPKKDVNVIHSTPERGHTKPELDNGYNANKRFFLTGDGSNRHEVHGDAQGYGDTELPDNSRY